MGAAALWTLAALLALVGLAGTVLPGLPGTVLLFAGLVLGAWADGFQRVGGWTLAGLGLLTALSFVVDFAASALGTRKAGASKWAALGAAIGGAVGLFFGIPGLLLGPFIGAVAGELLTARDFARAGAAGVGAGVGFLLGTAARVAIAFTMVAIFAAAWWW